MAFSPHAIMNSRLFPLLRRDFTISAVAMTVGYCVPARAQSAQRDVRSYGAKGDGVADDSSAIQTAINDSVGKSLLFPATSAFYKITKTLVVPPCNGIDLVINGELRLVLGRGETARCAIYGEDVGSLAISGGGVINGGADVDLRPGAGRKSSMAAVFFIRSSIGGRADISNLKITNAYTAACSVVNYADVNISKYDAYRCGVGHLNTRFAGESIVVKSANSLNITDFKAEDCTDGAGLLICKNVIGKRLSFINCGLGPDVPACGSVSIDGLVVRNPKVVGFTSVAWGAETIQRGAQKVVLNNVDISGTSGVGVGMALDSTDSALISGQIEGLNRGLVVSRSFLKQKFQVARNKSIAFNGTISNCSGPGITVSAVDQFSFSGKCFGNGRARLGSGNIVINTSDPGDSVGELALNLSEMDVQNSSGDYLVLQGINLTTVKLRGVEINSLLKRTKKAASTSSIKFEAF